MESAGQRLTGSQGEGGGAPTQGVTAVLFPGFSISSHKRLVHTFYGHLKWPHFDILMYLLVLAPIVNVVFLILKRFHILIIFKENHSKILYTRP